MGNGVSERMLAALVDPSLLEPHANYLRLSFHPLGARRHIVNWDEVATHLMARAERELNHAAHDETARELLSEIRGYAPPGPHRSPSRVTPADLLLPIQLMVNGVELRMFSTIMTLGTPRDVTLQELRVETFFPADPGSEAAWKTLLA